MRYSIIVALLCVHSSFAIILMGTRAGCVALFVFLVSRDCWVALPRDATGLSAVCDCGISDYFWTPLPPTKVLDPPSKSL